MRKTWVVMRREFLERVRTRWFVISTVLGPVIMVCLFAAPLLLAGSGARERSVGVLDLSTTRFGERLTEELDRSEPVRASRVTAEPANLEAAAESLATLVTAEALDGFVIVTDASALDGRFEYRGSNASSIRDMQLLSNYLEEAVLTERLAREGVEASVVRRAQIPVRLSTTKITAGGRADESGFGAFVLASVMWLVLYMAILIYGVSVMGSVVEEKTSRIVEVLISSLRPFELLAGKIVGVGAVGLFQLLIWGVFGAVLLSQQDLLLRLGGGAPNALAGFRLPHVAPSTVLVFLAYFVLGYFLYAAMFAAVAAMSSSEAEARHAQTPVVGLLVVPSILLVGILNDPGGSMAVALSLIPFCSPIAMPVRWAAAPIPTSELALSLTLLAGTLVAVVWLAARIFRVGILMYGKRPGLRELVRWARTG